MFEYEEEAKAVYEHLKTRLAKFGLELAEDKTRILPFGRNSGAYNEVRALYNHAMWVTYKWLNRRSQRKSFTLEKFYPFWNEKINKPRVHVNRWAVGKVMYI